MGVVVIDERRRFTYPPDALTRLVADVRTYPDFIPWVKSLTLKLEDADGEAWTGRAVALVGWKSFLERFETRVRSDPAQGLVDVSLISGPFRVLENKWRFQADGQGGALVRFWIKYQFKNPVLQAAATANRTLAANKIIAAFEQEAARRFGVG